MNAATLYYLTFEDGPNRFSRNVGNYQWTPLPCTTWPLKMGPIGTPETSVTNNRYCVNPWRGKNLIYTAVGTRNQASYIIWIVFPRTHCTGNCLCVCGEWDNPSLWRQIFAFSLFFPSLYKTAMLVSNGIWFRTPNRVKWSMQVVQKRR
jgi:hypothetical protein